MTIPFFKTRHHKNDIRNITALVDRALHDSVLSQDFAKHTYIRFALGSNMILHQPTVRVNRKMLVSNGKELRVDVIPTSS